MNQDIPTAVGELVAREDEMNNSFKALTTHSTVTDPLDTVLQLIDFPLSSCIILKYQPSQIEAALIRKAKKAIDSQFFPQYTIICLKKIKIMNLSLIKITI